MLKNSEAPHVGVSQAKHRGILHIHIPQGQSSLLGLNIRIKDFGFVATAWRREDGEFGARTLMLEVNVMC